MIDHLVVGAGSAGCVVAARLAATGATVVLLEAGGGDPPPEVQGLDFIAATRSPWVWPALTAVRSSVQGPRPYLRGRGVGGSSAVNALVAMDGLASDYDRWGLPGWDWASLAPARDRVRLVTEVAGQVGAVGRAVIEGWGALGHPVVEDSCRQLGAGPARLTMSAGRRVSAADCYLAGAAVDLRTGALVDRVLLDGKRATGVLLADGTELAARHVILSAGAIHTPAIALRSGIERTGIGANLQDHAAQAALLVLRSEHRAPPGAASVTALVRLSSGDAEGDLQFLALDHLGPDDGRGLGMVMVALMDVASRGRVALTSPDPHVDPLVEMHMLSDPDGHDERRLRVGLQALLDLLDTPALRAVAEEVYLDDRGTTPELLGGRDLGEFLRANLADYVHPVGTCAMGRSDDPAAVVDLDGHVIGYEALSVCDASVIPVLPRANTHLPVTIVAEELARRWTTGYP